MLNINNLNVEIPTRHGILKPVKDVSFSVEKGEILGLVGESGAGKSMIGSAINGLLTPPAHIKSGEVWFNENRIDAEPEKWRGKHIGMIFQDPNSSLNPVFKIGDQMIETLVKNLKLNKVNARIRAKELLDEVGVDPNRIDDYPHQFSGGMRQRVVIALTLASEPQLVIADEPTTALDVSVQARILELMKSICKARGASVILISHDMGVIAETCDRVAVLYAGRLVEIGTTTDIIRSPQHPYTQGLIASTPKIDPSSIDKELFQIPGQMPGLEQVPTGCAFHPRCPNVMDKCRQNIPPLFGNRTACWLHDEGGNT